MQAKAFDWLAERTNAFINVLRPRVRSAVAEQEAGGARRPEGELVDALVLRQETSTTGSGGEAGVHRAGQAAGAAFRDDSEGWARRCAIVVRRGRARV
jgi:hypothetical protein